jgi:hypothetical protein
MEQGAYRQMPYEEITEKKYEKMVNELKFLSFRQVKGNEAIVDKFCNNDTCEIELEGNVKKIEVETV